MLRVVDVALDLGEGDRRDGPRPWRSRIASPESFQPWLSRPRFERRSYSTNPSPSRSPHSSIQSSAAIAFGHSRSTRSRSPVQSKVSPRRISQSGVESIAAVVRGVRQLAGAGGLADPHLVEDLAGLGVAPLVDLGRLQRGEHLGASRPAIWGRNASAWIAVMIESRPNSVVNHGTPAAM